MTAPLHKLSIFGTLVVAISSCSIFDVLPGEPAKKKVVRPPVEEVPPPTVNKSKPPQSLGAIPLLRRMSLDLTNRLPSEADLQAVSDDPAVYYQLVDAYLATPAANEALAQMHRRIWKLNEDQLQVLEYYDDAGEVTTTLDESLRQKIVDEPVQYIRYALARNLPLNEWFFQNYTVAHNDVLSLWSWSADETVYAADGVSRSTFSDNRPGIGLLGSQGFWASITNRYSPHPRQKTADLMRRLACFNPQAAHAHQFYELTEDAYATEIISTAATTTPCKNCHAVFETPSATLGTIAQGASFSDWLNYAGEETSGTYSGHLFAGLPELTAFIANDPRFHQCEIKQIGEVLFQRTKTGIDNKNLIQAFDQMNNNDLDLKSAVSSLVKSKMYGYDRVTTKVKGSYVTGFSGIRFLNRRQWRGILQQLSRATSAIEPGPALEPGGDETITASDHVPTGRYWYATNRIARQAASAIVDQELADNYSVAARKVFKHIPDGSATGATSEQIQTQLQFLWRLLIGPEIALDSPQMSFLVNFWNEALDGRNTDDASRDAWRTILVGILTHPDFVTY